VFKGFTEETFSFFMAISVNNNVGFFEENRAWFERAVKYPLYELAGALAPTMLGIDPAMEIRPVKAVSRIRRDTRFTNDKSPYRDYMWLGFRPRGVAKENTLGFYFDMGSRLSHYGMGFYGDNRPAMETLRRHLSQDAGPFRATTEAPLASFELKGNRYKKLAVPESVPDDMRVWYLQKGFYMERTTEDLSLLKTEKLVDELICGYQSLTPMYQYLMKLFDEIEK